MPRYVHPNVLAYRVAGKPMVQRHLIWVTGRDYTTGDAVSVGFWDGQHDAELAVYHPVTGVTLSRTYHGAGSVLGVDPIQHPRGLDIHPVRITLSPTSPQVEQALRGYRQQNAPVELHRIWFDYYTREVLAPGHVWITGNLDRAPLTTPPVGGSAQLVFTVVPPTRALSFGNPELLSDTIQSQRLGDRILQYIATQGTREIPWMRK